MTRFIVVRHGNSIGNFKRIFIGQTDWKLSELGEKQVSLLTEYLKQYKVDKIYSSDLSRAYNTVLPYANYCGLKVIKRKGLREVFAGQWETKPISSLADNFEQYRTNWKNDFSKTVPEGGEPISHMYYRVKNAFARIAKENEGKTVLIATHATPIRAMNCIWHNDTLKNIQQYEWVPNASVSIVDYLDDGKYDIVEFGTSDFLGEYITTVTQLFQFYKDR